MNQQRMTFEVSPKGTGWQMTGVAGLLYTAPTREVVLEFARKLAEKTAPSRIVVLGSNGAVDDETRFEPDPRKST